MKKYCLLAAICLLGLHFAAFSQAKTWRIGAKGGFTIPNLEAIGEPDGTLSSGYSSRRGTFAGIKVQYQFTSRLGIITEFNYAELGGKKEGDQKIKTTGLGSLFPLPPGVPLPTYVYAQFNNYVNLNYLELPVMLQYHLWWNKKWRLTAYGGLFAGHMLQGKNIAEGRSKIYYDAAYTQPVINNDIIFDSNTDLKNDLNSFNWGLQGGGSLSYSFLPNWEVEFSGGGSYGLQRLQKDATFGNNRTGALMLTLGVQYKW